MGKWNAIFGISIALFLVLRAYCVFTLRLVAPCMILNGRDGESCLLTTETAATTAFPQRLS